MTCHAGGAGSVQGAHQVAVRLPRCHCDSEGLVPTVQNCGASGRIAGARTMRRHLRIVGIKAAAGHRRNNVQENTLAD